MVSSTLISRLRDELAKYTALRDEASSRAPFSVATYDGMVQGLLKAIEIIEETA